MGGAKTSAPARSLSVMPRRGRLYKVRFLVIASEVIAPEVFGYVVTLC